MWQLTSDLRTSTVGQLLYGRLSDIWSRKVVLLTGLAIFFIGSLASSLARSVLQLTIFRAFTGVGGGGLMTVAQLIVSDVVPLRERGKYQGILVSLANPASYSSPNCVPGGCRSSPSERYWTSHWRCHLVQVRGLMALDLPHEYAAYTTHYHGSDILYAAEEG